MAVTTGLSHSKAKELAHFYRRHLLQEVMPFWEARTEDKDSKGYLTCFDRAGNLTDANKYIWFQGRQLWMFSALYNHVQQRSCWLDLAKCGRDYITNQAYAGEGRWNYQLDRQGNVKHRTISIFTDMFVLQGLCEYSRASRSQDDLPLIEATYQAIQRNTKDPDFKDIFHGTWSPRYKRHGIYMMALNTAQLAEQVLGTEHTKPLIDLCLEQILDVFVKEEYEALFESVGRDGALIDDPEGRVLNPGHALESMWFCLEEGRRRKDQALIDKSVQVIDWMYQRGHDPQHGGMFAFLDFSGAEPKQMDWHKETNMNWHDKPWWVLSESMYALALAAVATGRSDMLERFLDLQDWSQKYYYDPQYGEWYAECYRDGRVKLTDKGTPWKAVYHLPRALMELMLLFEKCSQRCE